ncbi:molybdopterin-dependent oxidoreductase, partial [Rhizobium johnstonii]|uniref:molybdopterin-dependent oxidoreductase n=1 Tax=Rhizobium johnstonii TaxID=3019933 RepID=UPI003F962922
DHMRQRRHYCDIGAGLQRQVIGGLGQTFGTSAGTQDFDSVEHSEVVIVIGDNPTDGHPVLGSRMKKRLRQGAKLIVIDPRRTDIVRSP